MTARVDKHLQPVPGSCRLLEGMIAGFWSPPMVGTPAHVVQRILDLHEAGETGVALSFVDFSDGRWGLKTQILPLLDAAVRRAPEAVSDG